MQNYRANCAFEIIVELPVPAHSIKILVESLLTTNSHLMNKQQCQEAHGGGGKGHQGAGAAVRHLEISLPVRDQLAGGSKSV